MNYHIYEDFENKSIREKVKNGKELIKYNACII